MLIKFKHLIIENFLSFGYAELDLNDKGYTAINGINNCNLDNAQSNGAGKSSIFSAICYALTGETVQGIKSNLTNIYTTGGMKVELTFDVDSIPYKIIRSKDHKELGTTIKFYANEEDKSGKGVRDTEKIINDYLPDLTSELIGNVIILGQGMPQKFTNNTPSGRKEVLEKLSKSDFMIEDIKNRLTNRKIILSKELKDLELELNSSQSQLNIYNKQLPQLENQLQSLVAPNIEELNSINIKINQLNEEVNQLNSQLQTNRDQLEELNQQNLGITNKQLLETNQVKQEYQATLDNLQEQKYKIAADLNSLSAEIKRLKNITDICPTCGQKLPNVHKVDTTDKENQLQELKAQLSLIDENIKLVEEHKNKEAQKIEEKYKQEKLNTINSINDKKIEISNLNKKIDSYNNEIKHQSITLATLQASFNNYEIRKVEISKEINSTKQNIDHLTSKIMYDTMSKEDVGNRLDAINKMATLATRDFRGFLLTNVIEYINKRAKIYSQDIFGTDKVQFALDGNNLNVSYNEKLYESLSGGEQRRLNLIIQLSIRDMLMQFSNFSSNILVLDEIFDSLDSKSSDAVVNTISKRLTDTESVFIVTHRNNLALPTDSTITVIKNSQGVSSLTDVI